MTAQVHLIAVRERMLGVAIERLNARTDLELANAVVLANLMAGFCVKGDVDWDFLEAMQIPYARPTQGDSGTPAPADEPTREDGCSMEHPRSVEVRTSAAHPAPERVVYAVLRDTEREMERASVQSARGAPFPKLWTEEREAEFDGLWHAGWDTADMATHFRAKHDMNLTAAAVSAHASTRGLTHSDARKRARHERNSEAQRQRADRRLAKSLSLGRTPVEAIAGTLLMVPKSAELESTATPTEAERTPVGVTDGVQPALAVEAASQDSLTSERVEPPVDVVSSEPQSRADTIRQQMAVIADKSAITMPLAKRAIITTGWRAAKTYEEIAEEATKAGYRMTPGHVLAAVAQLGLTNDPDRRRAMHGAP